jgi:hypothetical protein
MPQPRRKSSQAPSETRAQKGSCHSEVSIIRHWFTRGRYGIEGWGGMVCDVRPGRWLPVQRAGGAGGRGRGRGRTVVVVGARARKGLAWFGILVGGGWLGDGG